MQAKKRYILVFISCAFLAYCYFGGYRLKQKFLSPASVTRTQRNEKIIIPAHLPSFLSQIECNGVNQMVVTDNDSNNAIDKIASSIYGSHVKVAANEEIAHHGSLLPSSTLQSRIIGKYFDY